MIEGAGGKEGTGKPEGASGMEGVSEGAGAATIGQATIEEWGQTASSSLGTSNVDVFFAPTPSMTLRCRKGHTWQAYSGVRFELEYAPGFFVDFNCPVCVLNVLLTSMQGVEVGREVI